MTFLKLILIVMLLVILAHGVLIHGLLNDNKELEERVEKLEGRVNELENRKDRIGLATEEETQKLIDASCGLTADDIDEYYRKLIVNCLAKLSNRVTKLEGK